MKNIKIDSDEEDNDNEMTSKYNNNYLSSCSHIHLSVHLFVHLSSYQSILGTVSIVTELPLDVQGYRIIDDSGPEGITMPVSCYKD